MAITAYPLTWPSGWKRTPAGDTRHAHFKTKSLHASGNYMQSNRLTVAGAVERILNQLSMLRMGREDVIISTNLRVRLDGMPRSDQADPSDAGAAVYWQKGGVGATRCMAIDQYVTVAGNLGAIAATLEAMRAIERHGGAEILDRAFTGFKALAAENDGESWWKTLDIEPTATREQVEAAYRAAARKAHTDVVGGSHEAMVRVNLAREQALAATAI